MHDLTHWTCPAESEEAPGPSARELLRLCRAAAARHRRLMALAFLGVFLGAGAAAFLLPPSYVANAKILIKRDRLDAPVTADASSAMPSPAPITDMEINSEVELIRSRDVLQKVALACGLLRAPGEAAPGEAARADAAPGEAAPADAALAAAVRQLQAALKVEPMPKTSLISVTYQAPDPRLAARVLQTLYGLYLEKHLAVHQPAGALEFFQNQRREYQQGLAQAEARLRDFGWDPGAVAPDQQKAVTLQKSAEFAAELQQTRAAMAQTQRRIQALAAESAGMPARLTAQVRRADNPQLMGQLSTTLLNLELKRTELLRKFEPGYALVREVDTEIAQTRDAITAAAQERLHDETTERNPAYDWVAAELTKARSELAGMEARAEALERSLRLYGQDARNLDRKEIARQTLLRDLNAHEDNYFLYLKKEEEARIAEALNRSRIVNVALVEPPTAPALPARSRGLLLLLALAAALAASVGAVAAAEYLNPPPRPIAPGYELLGVPVLAPVARLDLETAVARHTAGRAAEELPGRR